LDNALDLAIDALQHGRPLDAVLYDQREQQTALRPLIEVADALNSPPRLPLARALPHNYAIVRAAVERAQLAAESMSSPAPAKRWWQRRLTFASASIPVGAAVLLLTAGAAGATASVATTDVGQRMADAVMPSWLEDHVPGIGADDPPGRGDRPAPSVNPASPGGDTPGADNRPTLVTLEGSISDVNGNTFTLSNPDGDWLVQVDSGTDISGEILEGATASVTGDLTAQKNLHATSVTATGGIPATEHPGSDGTRGPDGTPPPQGTPGGDLTPGPEKTPGPPESAGPPMDGATPGPPFDPADTPPETPPGSASQGDQQGDDGENEEP
jgi:hypothetical protein